MGCGPIGQRFRLTEKADSPFSGSNDTWRVATQRLVFAVGLATMEAPIDSVIGPQFANFDDRGVGAIQRIFVDHIGLMPSESRFVE